MFSALRYPERFLWVGILFACEPAANALSRIPHLGDGKKWRLESTVTLTLAVIVTVCTQLFTFDEVGQKRELGVVTETKCPEFHQASGNRWLAAHYDGIGAGSLSCWETHPVVMSPKLRGDLAAEEYIADPKIGIAKRTSWSPNRLVVHASLASEGRLLVNQNWHPGWRASVGRVVSDEGLLAVDLPPGEHDVVLSFRPMSAIAGAAVTGVGLLSLVLLARCARCGGRPSAAARSS